MPINATEYQKKFCKTKIVKLEEGVEFEIKNISLLDLWDDSLEKVKEKKPSSTANYMRKVVVAGVISPLLSFKEEEGKLNVSHLQLNHLNKLVEEITELSGFNRDFLSQKGKA